MLLPVPRYIVVAAVATVAATIIVPSAWGFHSDTPLPATSQRLSILETFAFRDDSAGHSPVSNLGIMVQYQKHRAGPQYASEDGIGNDIEWSIDSTATRTIQQGTARPGSMPGGHSLGFVDYSALHDQA